MIPKGATVDVADNSGARRATIFGIFGGSKHLSCKVGDLVKVAIQSVIPNSMIKGNLLKKGDVYNAIVVRSKYPIKRKDGTYSRAGSNAVILLSNDNEVISTRMFGYIAREAIARVNINSSICEGVY